MEKNKDRSGVARNHLCELCMIIAFAIISLHFGRLRQYVGAFELSDAQVPQEMLIQRLLALAEGPAFRTPCKRLVRGRYVSVRDTERE